MESESLWFSSQLGEEIIKNNDVLEQTQNVVTDLLSNRLDIADVIENMAVALTHKDAENRERGMRFLTKILKELPNYFLNVVQIKFISNFYTDRLKDNHRVIPHVIEGYLALIDMKNYDTQLSGQFFLVLFKEVTCQSQLRQDRKHIYMMIKEFLDRDLEYIKSQGPDFVYGVISAMDGERDPRNLLFLFKFLPQFISQVPLGHLTEEMFDVISCYYPIDFHPAPGDPTAVSRDELAIALSPCLCAVPEFGEPCLQVLVEKLDSTLQVAKLDSLKLLAESCKTFNAETYGPFLKTLWASIRREICNKTDDSLKMAAHEALSALVTKLSTTACTDHAFETFIEGILISMQAAIAESTNVTQFVQASKVLATTGNASKESCVIVCGAMIPAIIAFYGFKTCQKLQFCSLDFLSDLYDIAKHWEMLDRLDRQVKEIPRHCLTAVSEPAKEYQIAGFKTLIRAIDALDYELVLPFVEVLIYHVQYSHDTDLLTVSIETIHQIAKKYPELIMSLVVKGKCDLHNLTEDKTALQERLNLLSNLLSIDDFTKVIIEEMLKLITKKHEEASKVIIALNENLSNPSLYSNQKVTQIESDHNLISSVLPWLLSEIESSSHKALSHGFALVSNTISSLPPEKQVETLNQHTEMILEKCEKNEIYFHLLESLYISVHPTIYTEKFPDIMAYSLKLSLTGDNEMIRMKACALTSHFLNKAEFGPHFELLYEFLKKYLTSCSGMDSTVCPKLILLYGWILKALVMRGSDLFLFWLQKLVSILKEPNYCKTGAEAICLTMATHPYYFTPKHHCRISLLYKQRMFIAFSGLVENITAVPPETKESYLLCWAYVIGKAPKSLLNNEVVKLVPLIIDSLEYDNKDLLLVMMDVLCYFIQSAHAAVADSLQTILPRLITLAKYENCMDVRMKALQCLFDIGSVYDTMLLLPYKPDILIDLAPTLDDKKRLVRNMAVKARSRWFLIGAPGEVKPN